MPRCIRPLSPATLPRLTLLLALAATPALAAAQEPAAPAAPPAAEQPMVDAPWFKVGWPKIQAPSFSWKPWGGDAATPSKPRENPVSGALDKVADTSKRAATSVRNAWGSAVNKISSFGAGPKEPPSQAVAKSDSPGFFSRFFGGDDDAAKATAPPVSVAQQTSGTVAK